MSKEYYTSRTLCGGFRSFLEYDFADFLNKNKVPFEYEKHSFKYEVPAKTARYTPDFKVGNIFFETKGLWTVTDRQKHLLIKKQYPLLDIRIIFQKNNPLYKGSKTRYSDYCDSHKIVYSVGKQIPKEWWEDILKEINQGELNG